MSSSSSLSSPTKKSSSSGLSNNVSESPSKVTHKDHVRSPSPVKAVKRENSSSSSPEKKPSTVLPPKLPKKDPSTASLANIKIPKKEPVSPKKEAHGSKPTDKKPPVEVKRGDAAKVLSPSKRAYKVSVSSQWCAVFSVWCNAQHLAVQDSCVRIASYSVLQCVAWWLYYQIAFWNSERSIFFVYVIFGHSMLCTYRQHTLQYQWVSPLLCGLCGTHCSLWTFFFFRYRRHLVMTAHQKTTFRWWDILYFIFIVREMLGDEIGCSKLSGSIHVMHNAVIFLEPFWLASLDTVGGSGGPSPGKIFNLKGLKPQFFKDWQHNFTQKNRPKHSTCVHIDKLLSPDAKNLR